MAIRRLSSSSWRSFSCLSVSCSASTSDMSCRTQPQTNQILAFSINAVLWRNLSHASAYPSLLGLLLLDPCLRLLKRRLGSLMGILQLL
jgi:hypothetical protein